MLINIRKILLLGISIFALMNESVGIEVSPLFEVNFNAPVKVMINQGGTSSGKTYAIIQCLFFKAVEIKREIMVIAESVPALKKGAFKDAQEIYGNLPDEVKVRIRKFNHGERCIYFHNGSKMSFVSFKDKESAKHGKRDISFFNEATGIDYEIYKAVALRTTETIYIDYNPSATFWVHLKLLHRNNTKLIISDHRHNPFLSEEKHKEIEDTKFDDIEYFNVYARGRTGKIKGLIFKKWSTVDQLPESYSARWLGLDFGFTNSKTALVECRYYDGKLWCKLHLYETGLTNPEIAERIKDLGLDHLEVVCDSAEPKSIQELCDNGIIAIGVEKGRGSVDLGIDLLKRYYINITSDSVEMVKEISKYCWKVDRVTDMPINKPIKIDDHAMDALKYIALEYLFNRGDSEESEVINTKY